MYMERVYVHSMLLYNAKAKLKINAIFFTLPLKENGNVVFCDLLIIAETGSICKNIKIIVTKGIEFYVRICLLLTQLTGVTT